jgi:Mce-associated membrane protein
VLLAVTAHSNSNRRAVAAARVGALAAAKREAAPFLTYDYRTFDRDVARAEVGMSTKFRASYAHTQASQVKALALKNHSSSHATVVAAGVVSATANRVKVLVFADQVVQNTLLQATSRLDQDQIELFMVKQGGRWVIDDVHTF